MQIESKYAIFNFDEIDETLAFECAEYLDAHALDIFKFFDVAPKEKAIINIVPTKSQFDDEYRTNNNLDASAKVENWVAGFVPTNNMQIYLLSVDALKDTVHAFEPSMRDSAVQEFKKRVVHEFVHFVQRQYDKEHNCKNMNTWLREGIATCLANQYEDEEKGIFASKQQIIEGKANYNDFKWLVKYLIDNYDKDLIFTFIESGTPANVFLRNELYDKAKNFYEGLNESKKLGN